MEFKEHHYLSEDGLRLYYREYGGGDRTVICLPGLTRNSKDFHGIASHLSSEYRVICPDLRGRGQSARDTRWKNYNIVVYLSDISLLIREVQSERSIFLGTSLGAMISMNLTYVHPENVGALILNDLGPEIDPAGKARILASVGKTGVVRSWPDAVEECRLKYGPALPEMPAEFWADFAHKTFREDPSGVPVLDIDPKIGDALKLSMKLAGVLGFLRAVGLVRKFRGVPIDPWDAFRAVRIPCLVMRGENSDILSEEIIDHMQAVKPDLVRATIPMRGHAPLLDEPESLSAIDAFLGGLA
jgi:pimeloyl-ACP methyl ester carboxylesterase